MVGELTLPGNGFRLPITPRLKEILAGKVGSHVVLGIRPENFHVEPGESKSDWAPMTFQLNVVEPLGNDMDLYLSTTLHPHVVARVEAHGDLKIATQLTVYVDLRKVHVFEPGETGMNLGVSELSHAIA
jgi:ABC-type sugar transport system ATPase subunit